MMSQGWPVCYTLAPSSGPRISFIGVRLAWVPASLPALAHAACYRTASGRIVVEVARTDHASRVCSRAVEVFERPTEAAAWLARREPEAGQRCALAGLGIDPGEVK